MLNLPLVYITDYIYEKSTKLNYKNTGFCTYKNEVHFFLLHT